MSFIFGAFGNVCKTFDKRQQVQIAKTLDGHFSSIVSDHLMVFAGTKLSHPNQVIVLPRQQGIITGKIFDVNSYHPPHFTDEIQDLSSITKQIWGQYVGILRHLKTPSVTLFRDPLGLSTLFYCLVPDGIIFASELSLLYDLLEKKPSIHWNYFAEYMIHANHTLSTTPFTDIQELLPGMGLTIDLKGKVSEKFMWNLSKSQPQRIFKKEAFEEELLDCLKKCTKAWTTGSKGICVELSGGTDSSATLILLREVLPPDIPLIAVNFIDPTTISSNEIEYAKEVANICEVPLYFADLHDNDLLDPLPLQWKPNRPSSFMLTPKNSLKVAQLAQEHGCDIVMNGQGGDHVFLAPPPKEALADVILSGNLTLLPSTIQGLSNVYRIPWWPLIQHNAKSIMKYYLKRSPVGASSAPHVVKTVQQQPFYLNHQLHRFHPGKAQQIETLYHAVAYAERDQTMSPHLHPLLSQPLVELALKIPTYQSFEDGYDRIFFRRAVHRLKPVKTLWRRMKGETTASMMKNFASHADKLGDFIMQGNLYKTGLINKEWLHTELTRVKHSHSETLWPLIYILTSQKWLNRWGF